MSAKKLQALVQSTPAFNSFDSFHAPIFKLNLPAFAAALYGAVLGIVRLFTVKPPYRIFVMSVRCAHSGLPPPATKSDSVFILLRRFCTPVILRKNPPPLGAFPLWVIVAFRSNPSRRPIRNIIEKLDPIF